jgi:hypothetical protein
VSADDGFFAFDVTTTPGIVRLTSRAGWTAAEPVPYSPQNWSGLDITAAFAVRQGARVTGQIRNDVVGNGNTQGVKMAGVDVYLDLDQDGVPDPNEPVSRTDQEGVFTFVPGPGMYVVRPIAPAGHVMTGAGATSRTATVPAGSLADVSVGLFTAYNPEGDNASVYGIVRQVPDLLGAHGPDVNPLEGAAVWIDANQDGKWSTGEASTTTDASGFYALWGLKTGSNNVTIALPPGYVNSDGRTVVANGYWFTGGEQKQLYVDAYDAAPIDVADHGFRRDARGLSLWVKFNKDVGYSLEPSDVVFENVSTGQAFPVTIAWDGARRTALFNPAPAAGGALPDGNYRVTLKKGGIKAALGDVTAREWRFESYVLAGDVNGDRGVDFADLVVLAQNYNAGGRTLADGDLNGDGRVDFADLVVLAQRYNTVLAAPAPLEQAAAVRSHPTGGDVFLVERVQSRVAPARKSILYRI